MSGDKNEQAAAGGKRGRKADFGEAKSAAAAKRWQRTIKARRDYFEGDDGVRYALVYNAEDTHVDVYKAGVHVATVPIRKPTSQEPEEPREGPPPELVEQRVKQAGYSKTSYHKGFNWMKVSLRRRAKNLRQPAFLVSINEVVTPLEDAFKNDNWHIEHVVRTLDSRFSVLVQWPDNSRHIYFYDDARNADFIKGLPAKDAFDLFVAPTRSATSAREAAYDEEFYVDDAKKFVESYTRKLRPKPAYRLSFMSALQGLREVDEQKKLREHYKNERYKLFKILGNPAVPFDVEATMVKIIKHGAVNKPLTADIIDALREERLKAEDADIGVMKPDNISYRFWILRQVLDVAVVYDESFTDSKLIAASRKVEILEPDLLERYEWLFDSAENHPPLPLWQELELYRFASTIDIAKMNYCLLLNGTALRPSELERLVESQKKYRDRWWLIYTKDGKPGLITKTSKKTRKSTVKVERVTLTFPCYLILDEPDWISPLSKDKELQAPKRNSNLSWRRLNAKLDNVYLRRSRATGLTNYCYCEHSIDPRFVPGGGASLVMEMGGHTDASMGIEVYAPKRPNQDLPPERYFQFAVVDGQMKYELSKEINPETVALDELQYVIEDEGGMRFDILVGQTAYAAYLTVIYMQYNLRRFKSPALKREFELRVLRLWKTYMRDVRGHRVPPSADAYPLPAGLTKRVDLGLGKPDVSRSA